MAQAQQFNYSVSLLFLREGDSWVAQCLEWDIAAQGESIREAQRALENTFVSQIIVDLANGKQPLEDVPKAPRFYWNQFEKALRVEGRKPFYLGERIPPPFMIQAAANDLRISA